MVHNKFQTAELEREGLAAELQMLEANLNDHVTHPMSEPFVDQCLESTALVKDKLKEINTTLHVNAPSGTDMAALAQTHATLFTKAMRIYAALKGIKLKFPVPTPAAPTPGPTPAPSTLQPEIRLPSLELPSFNGNLQEWVSFKDMFQSAVGNKSSLSNSQKLTYLKSCLTGEAARQIRSLVLSDANYDIAWKSLSDRYQNDRELLFHILKRFTNQPNVNSNASSIRSLVDTSKECISSLEILNLPVNQWSAIMLFILFQKLDQPSKELWEQSLKDSSIPAVDDLFSFLEQRARALSAGGSTVRNQPNPRIENQHQQRKVAHNHHVQPSPSPPCKLSCGGNHPLFRCKKFYDSNVNERLEIVKKNKLCTNCFGEGHKPTDCKNKHSCKICNQRHHTMIHIDGATTLHVVQKGLQTALLATSVVKLIDDNGASHYYRALLDAGSETSFISEACAKKLKLKTSGSVIQLTGLQGTSVGTAKGYCTFNINPRFRSNNTYNITALIVPKVTKDTPATHCDSSNWHHIKNLTLADPEFNDPAPIDLLLGGDLFWTVLLPQKIEGDTGTPVAFNSTLGWLIAGKRNNSAQLVASTHVTDIVLDNHLRKFWENETIPEHPTMTTEEKQCESHFAATHTRDDSGRFTVEIPWKTPRPPLGSSRAQALTRLHQLEKRLAPNNTKNPAILKQKRENREEYNKFMGQYEEMGHMSLVPEDEVLRPKNPVSYIPHHFIRKDSSTTTKFRVVYDASAKTTSNYSLNDMMMIGPTIQDPLMDIILRFRTHPIAYTADIEKMYRQILVTPQDADMQRILWRDDPSLPIKEYRLNTVTYGTASAPYVATKCLQQLAADAMQTHLLASEIAACDFYVDDLMSGAKSTRTAIATIGELNDLCMSGGFPLRKWTCNSEEVLSSLPDELKETKTLIPIDEDQSVKTLGIFWNPREDKYHFKINIPPDMPGTYTKRKILSEMSKIFDPLGWLAPCIIQAKIFMQLLWKNHHDWDETLPAEIQAHWDSFKSSLHLLEEIKIPRCVLPHNPIRIILCGFSDASRNAYSAVLYTCCFYEDQPPQATLVTSKTRVAPVKATTIPRLELNGALLLSQLVTTSVKAMKVKFDEIRCFTDSSIVLAWIRSSPLRWKTYVRNRVQEIQDNTSSTSWFHVRGEENPADCASRGINASDLLHHSLWWTGNETMKQLTMSTATDDQIDLDEVKNEEREPTPISTHITAPKERSVFQLFSNFTKLQRIISWIYRFYNNCKSKKSSGERRDGPLTIAELNSSLVKIMSHVQREEFSTELQLISSDATLPINNKLLPLSPFISSDGLLRVGGRLKNAPIPTNQRHPILLPRNHHITKLLIQSTHLKYFHAGPQLTLSILNQQFWIIRGRDAVRYELKRCVICTRLKANAMTQFMGELPAARVTPSQPFNSTGVDYAGPFTTKPLGRSKTTYKTYLAIFICFATKAIHLELVGSLSTDAFIAALRKFVGRRGIPANIYSDCGTNFVGANKVLTNMFLNFSPHDDKVSKECTSMGIQWHFNPPGSPHFGGLWEAGVKSVKYHLTRAIGTALLTWDELETLIIQIESVLNSRPITPASTDPADLTALTPAHFLIGKPLTALPDPDFTDTKIGRLDRWQLLQQQQQAFWRRWSSEFITRLQRRPKWMNISPQIKVNDMVIIKDERLPPLRWKLGRILQVHPGADGITRVVTVKTSEGELKRPVAKLCILPIDNDISQKD